MPEPIPFSKPSFCDEDLDSLSEVLRSGRLAGGDRCTKAAHAWLEAATGCRRALITGSGTQALEMACLLIDLKPGDEVILPSFTFSSSANAIVLRGAVPVFVDIRPDTLNIDEQRIEEAVSDRTRAIMPVHYAGVGCEMERIGAIAAARGLTIIEDAAQAVCAAYRGKPLGSFGALAALSFHASKNISCGEGGALLINDERFAERAEVLWEKGTNRAQFLRGEIDKYTWYDLGSSFLPSEIAASVLVSQLGRADAITRARTAIWERYHAGFAALEEEGVARRPQVPADCAHNGHIYYLILASEPVRAEAMEALRQRGIATQFHYVPLHSSPAGRRFGRASGSLAVTDDLAGRLLRIPLFPDLSADDQARVIDQVSQVVRQTAPRSASQSRSTDRR